MAIRGIVGEIAKSQGAFGSYSHERIRGHERLATMFRTGLSRQVALAYPRSFPLPYSLLF